MVRLSVDGRAVEVPEGASVLEAAREVGIEVPTLCHLEGVEAAGSCFMCVVRVEGKENLVPSCVCPAEEGMEVVTDSEEIRAARRTALELLLSDHRGDCEAPCTLGCPAGVDIPEFIRLIRDGDDREAQAVIKRRIPLPGALGRICPRYCERVCRRGDFDEPIAICALKRYPSEVDYAAGDPYLAPKKPAGGKNVAIVGAGPAGLTAAWYLLQQGHECTLLDAHEEPGGMLRYGIPDFRMPSPVVRQEVEVIRRMGAKFRLETMVGSDVGFEELLTTHDALLLATGAQDREPAGFDGAELCESGTEVLRQLARGEKPDVGERVVVLGDGDVAVAAARCARRLGAGRVTILSEKNRRRMGCIRERADAAETEGVSLICEAVPVGVRETEDGLQVRYVMDEEERELPADRVISAPVRQVDLAPAETLGLETSRGKISADRPTTATGREGVFAAGEVASGPGAAVRAVAAGRVAALSIDQFLRGLEVTGEESPINVRMGKLSEEEKQQVFAGYEMGSQLGPDTLPPQERLGGFEEIEKALTPERAREEAARCLECDCLARDDCRLRDYGTEYGAGTREFTGECRGLGREDSHPTVQYESGKCILCGLCVRITEESEEPGLTFHGRGFPTRTRVPFGRRMAEGVPYGLAERCADACPTGALARKRTATRTNRDGH